MAITPALAIAPPLGGEPDLSVATNHYRDHQDELVALYPGQYLVLVGTHLHGAYPSLPQAYRTAREELPQASFLIQECQPGEQANTQVYATPNVAFFSSSR